MHKKSNPELASLEESLQHLIDNPRPLASADGSRKRLKHYVSESHARGLRLSQLSYSMFAQAPISESKVLRRAIELLTARTVEALRDPSVAAQEARAITGEAIH